MAGERGQLPVFTQEPGGIFPAALHHQHQDERVRAADPVRIEPQCGAELVLRPREVPAAQFLPRNGVAARSQVGREQQLGPHRTLGFLTDTTAKDIDLPLGVALVGLVVTRAIHDLVQRALEQPMAEGTFAAVLERRQVLERITA